MKHHTGTTALNPQPPVSVGCSGSACAGKDVLVSPGGLHSIVLPGVAPVTGVSAEPHNKYIGSCTAQFLPDQRDHATALAAESAPKALCVFFCPSCLQFH